jgi:hypothetical protein
MGYPGNNFLEAYYKNIGLQTEEALEANPVAMTVMRFIDSRMKVLWRGCYNSLAVLEFVKVDTRQWYRGTFSGLLKDLETVAQRLNINTRSKQWPKSPNYLSRRLNEVKTNLREVGITIERLTDANKNTRLVEICKVPHVSPVSPVIQFHAFKQPENTGYKTGSGDTVSPKEKVSPGNNEPNCVQNSGSGETYDNGDTLHSSSIAMPAKANTTNTEFFSCKKFPLMSHPQGYEKHVVGKKTH